MSRSVLLQVEAGGGTEAACARVEAARNAGFDGVEWLTSVDGASEPFRNDALISSIHHVRSLMPMVIVAAECASIDEADLMDEVRTAVRIAGVVAPTTLSISFPPLRGNDSATGFDSYQSALNAVHRVLRSLRFEAASLGVTLAVVVPQDGFLLSPVETRELIESINAWNFGACVDAGRVQPIGRLVDWIATLGPRVRAVRIGDNGESGIGMRENQLVEAMNTIPYDVPLIVSSCVPESRWSEWLDIYRTNPSDNQV